jgi:2'-5' RNA ligase
VTGTLNRWIWRAPLPHRVVARLSAWVYRNPPMPGSMVLTILDTLRGAGVRAWISGGWGVDALAGRQSRTHRDLDLIIEEHDRQRAMDVLGQLGFWEWYLVDSDRPLFSRIVLHDNELAGRAIDLHPLELSQMDVELNVGTIEGREVPCISPDLQLATHSNYRKRWRDRADIAIVRRLLEGATTSLIVPVAVADPLLHESSREPGLPAHITVLYPFLTTKAIDDATGLALASVVEDVAAFEFVLSEIRRFPGVVYLAPEPATPFIALTEALVERWPSNPPYEGAFDEITPHLTVAYGESVPESLAAQLPVAARAEEVWLMSRVAGRWVQRRRFPLGSSTDRAR